MNRITCYVVSEDWPLSLGTIFSRLTHVVACVSTPFLLDSPFQTCQLDWPSTVTRALSVSLGEKIFCRGPLLVTLTGACYMHLFT